MAIVKVSFTAVSFILYQAPIIKGLGRILLPRVSSWPFWIRIT